MGIRSFEGREKNMSDVIECNEPGVVRDTAIEQKFIEDMLNASDGGVEVLSSFIASDYAQAMNVEQLLVLFAKLDEQAGTSSLYNAIAACKKAGIELKAGYVSFSGDGGDTRLQLGNVLLDVTHGTPTSYIVLRERTGNYWSRNEHHASASFFERYCGPLMEDLAAAKTTEDKTDVLTAFLSSDVAQNVMVADDLQRIIFEIADANDRIHWDFYHDVLFSPDSPVANYHDRNISIALVERDGAEDFLSAGVRHTIATRTKYGSGLGEDSSEKELVRAHIALFNKNDKLTLGELGRFQATSNAFFRAAEKVELAPHRKALQETAATWAVLTVQVHHMIGSMVDGLDTAVTPAALQAWSAHWGTPQPPIPVANGQ